MPDDKELLVGFDAGDDAGVYRINEDTALILTVDFFTPIVDDPADYGAIACANSVSDIYAMGGTPLAGLNIACFPSEELELSLLSDILEGAAGKAAEGGFPIIGGHCVRDDEPKYGLAVTGTVHPDRIITKGGAKPGDQLVLTKPIGTGIITTAIKKGIAENRSIAAAVDAMKDLNDDAAEVAQSAEVESGTDVTGFGLLGHLQQIMEESRTAARIRYDDVPLLPSVESLAEEGSIPGGSRSNLDQISEHVDSENQVTEQELHILADAQTSGGLLLCVPESEVEGVLDALAPGPSYYPDGGTVIGEVESGPAGTVKVF